MQKLWSTKTRDDPVPTAKIIEVKRVIQMGDVLAHEGERSGIIDASNGKTQPVWCVFIKEIYMTTLGKLVMRVGLLSLLSALPLAAQVDNGVDFTTVFPFYAGSTKLPAGSYKVTQPDLNTKILLIKSSDGSHSVFVDCTPTESVEPHGKSDVTFHKYGDTDYLDRVSIGGETEGVMLEPSNTEMKAAANASLAHRSVVSNRQ
jgi:hypothetical protein